MRSFFNIFLVFLLFRCYLENLDLKKEIVLEINKEEKQKNIKKSKEVSVIDEKKIKKMDDGESVKLEEKIAGMLMLGFFGTEAPLNSQICKDIRDYNLGGVILFDLNPVKKTKAKNIFSKNQLLKLTKQLKNCSPRKELLIAVDQEGGRVQRLKSKYGFYGKYPMPSVISKASLEDVKTIYSYMAKELANVGINFNLAPSVDLAINPKNVVINKLGRSYGKEPSKVIKYSSIFLDAMNSNNIYTSLKHFPGHGSTLGDTHNGFVDATKSWKRKELVPYQVMIDKFNIDTIMVAHIFNSNLDIKYPASLSFNTITKLLREKMNYRGVVITDDLQMKAISKHYSIKETLKLSINAGVDILLFGNQLDPKNMISTKKLVEEVKKLVNENEIDISKINNAYKRIKRLKSKYNIIRK